MHLSKPTLNKLENTPIEFLTFVLINFSDLQHWFHPKTSQVIGKLCGSEFNVLIISLYNLHDRPAIRTYSTPNNQVLWSVSAASYTC